VGRRARRVRANKDGAFDGAGHGCGKEIYGGLQPFYGDVFTVTVRAATRLLVVTSFLETHQPASAQIPCGNGNKESKSKGGWG